VAAGKEGRYGNAHYEIASLSLADLFRGKNEYSEAAAAYEQASGIPKFDPDIEQRANLGAGEMYDLLKERDLALKKYQAAISAGANTPLADTANRYTKTPYQGQ
jgi:tetratricopeptide (TPR) repeat protein